jgi:hypothetical protein
MIPRLSALLLFVFCCFIAPFSWGQAGNAAVPEWMLASLHKDSYAAWQIYLKHHDAHASKSAGTAQRLVAFYNVQHGASGNADVEDSTAYFYSGSRGINPKGGTMYISNMRIDMLFDSGTSYRWFPAQGSYKAQKRVRKSFNAQQLPDSFIYQQLNVGLWDNTVKGIYTYYVSGKERTYRAESWDASSGTWAYPTVHHYAYNAAGDITLDSLQVSNMSSGAMINNARIIYAYDGLGRLSTILQQSWSSTGATWDNVQKDSISYTAAGKVAAWASWYFNAGSSSWIKDYRDVSYYNPLDFEIAAVHEFGKNGNWTSWDSAVHNVLNTAGFPLFDSIYNTYPILRLNERVTNTYTPTNQVSTVLRELYNGGFLNAERRFSFYDANDQPIRHYNQAWDGSAWTFDGTTSEQRYYYEPYNTTGIQGTGRPAESVDAYVYPVPARNSITLAMSLSSQQDVKAAIYDAAGRLQLSWKESVRAGLYTKDLSVAALPAGTYYLSADGEQWHWSGRFVVTH